jgi:class 3 adenylate cyclase
MSTDHAVPMDPSNPTADLGPLPRFLAPFVDWVAGVRASVHVKLLAGFLLIALLLLAMSVVSIVVLNRVDRQVDTLSALNDQTNRARQMIYAVTAQSHYRAMALLTDDPSWTDKIYVAKQAFADDLSAIQTSSLPADDGFFESLTDTNDRYEASSDVVTDLYEDRATDRALEVHIQQEHEISHELEDSLNVLLDRSQALVVDQTRAFDGSRRFLAFAVATFSGVSLLGALALGAVLSWSVIRPVRRVDGALERIADGDFGTRVEVPNRDEFGNLTRNLNRTTEQLSTLYEDLSSLNAHLQEAVDAKVEELERANRLKRYLSPQLAESIVAAGGDVILGPRRKYLTTFFSDVRGFTAASERMEPEELVDQLNEYLSEMTEIVFRHGGTLDKYVGDALMVFFGDPVHQDDHAARAVRMALEMRERMDDLVEAWARRFHEPFRVGIGIATGWVTVGDIGSPARSDYTVVGNEVNLASRLAGRAGAGQILATEATMREVGDIVDGTLVDEISLKGVSREVRVYEIRPRPAPASGL